MSFSFLQGNILVLDDGKLGLIDYGNTRRLDDPSRLAYARVVDALGRDADDKVVANAFLKSGFKAKDEGDIARLSQYAMLFFDSDDISWKLGTCDYLLLFAFVLNLYSVSEAF